MIESWKEALEKGKSITTIFKYVSKAFDTLNHDLFQTKLNAYGFNYGSINYPSTYLHARINQSINQSINYIFPVSQYIQNK